MIKLLPPRTAFISATFGSLSTLLTIDQAFSDAIDATVDFGAGDYFYLTIYEGNVREEIKVTDKTGLILTVTRAQGGTTAAAFSLAAKYVVEINRAAVEDMAATIVPPAGVDLEGTGVAQVTDNGGGSFTINVETLEVTGENGVEVSGTWPNLTISLTNEGNCCAGEETPVAGTTLIGGGIVNISDTDDGTLISVPAPNFTGVGVEITGTWPNYTFTVTAGGVGTVVSVGAGSGLAITGGPTVNPTVVMSNTGVAAGDYSGVIINARGQITAVPATFDPISVATPGAGIAIARSAGSDEITISAAAAAVGTAGIVELADESAPLDDTDVSTAVTPALLAAVIADLAEPEALGGQSYSGEADGDYTATLPTTAIALVLASGEKAIVFVNTTARGAVLTDPVNYGLGVFMTTAGTRIQSNKKINQNEQNMVFIIAGPFNDGLTLKHTALAGGESVVSYSMVALKV